MSKNYSKTYKAPKRRNVLHLQVRMKSGAGKHKVAESPRRAGPSIEEYEDDMAEESAATGFKLCDCSGQLTGQHSYWCATQSNF